MCILWDFKAPNENVMRQKNLVLLYEKNGDVFPLPTCPLGGFSNCQTWYEEDYDYEKRKIVVVLFHLILSPLLADVGGGRCGLVIFVYLKLASNSSDGSTRKDSKTNRWGRDITFRASIDAVFVCSKMDMAFLMGASKFRTILSYEGGKEFFAIPRRPIFIF